MKEERGLDRVWGILDRGHLVRRASFVFMLILTWECYAWVMTLPGLYGATGGTAAIMAAILTPLSGLQAAFIGFYNQGRRQKGNDQD